MSKTQNSNFGWPVYWTDYGLEDTRTLCTLLWCVTVCFPSSRPQTCQQQRSYHHPLCLPSWYRTCLRNASHDPDLQANLKPEAGNQQTSHSNSQLYICRSCFVDSKLNQVKLSHYWNSQMLLQVVRRLKHEPTATRCCWQEGTRGRHGGFQPVVQPNQEELTHMNTHRWAIIGLSNKVLPQTALQSCFQINYEWLGKLVVFKVIKQMMNLLMCNNKKCGSQKHFRSQKQFRHATACPLTMAGCLLLSGSPGLEKAWGIPPMAPLAEETAASRPCMSAWAPGIPGTWPTAWLRSTLMASSSRSSILFCCGRRFWHLPCKYVQIFNRKVNIKEISYRIC